MIDFDRKPPIPPLHRGYRCLIFGAGNIGRELLNVFRRTGIEIVRFLESAGERGAELEGVPVSHPAEVPETERSLPVVVGVFSSPPRCSTGTIAAFLARHGFHRIIDFETIFQSCPKWFPPHFWLADPAFFRERRSEIEKARRLFIEPRSLSIFDSLMAHRLGGSWTELSSPSPADEQYFPPDLPIPGDGCTFVDVGAFDGDTIEQIRRRGIVPRRIFAYEPELVNYRRLGERIAALDDWGVEIAAHPIGCGARVESAALTGSGASAALTAGTDGGVPVTSLDRMLNRIPVDYVKMDVEGFEEACLLGMRQLIERYRPILAVCVYHRPQDLHALPLLVAELEPSYRLYLRVYGSHCFDTVLYAIPACRIRD